MCGVGMVCAVVRPASEYSCVCVCVCVCVRVCVKCARVCLGASACGSDGPGVPFIMRGVGRELSNSTLKADSGYTLNPHPGLSLVIHELLQFTKGTNNQRTDG